ncbi:MAG: hypothetical protein A3G27_10340 [Betaproteobacteria bacterium RIFCSPLOWO2_12_FULL_66_14]|nr:MAG: hypothetical protein A3G27_10340 [Betaproteobacteria bacterium RIFCSPLOWO2_12_FULL_66_14]
MPRVRHVSGSLTCGLVQFPARPFMLFDDTSAPINLGRFYGPGQNRGPDKPETVISISQYDAAIA